MADTASTEYPQWVTEHPIKDIRPAPSGLVSRPNAVTRHAYALTLTTGEEVYGCAHCPYVSISVKAVLSRHFGSAHPERTAAAVARNRPVVSGGPGRPRGLRSLPDHLFTLALADLLALAARPDDGEWKRRALKAEKERDALRKALRPLLAEDGGKS